MPRNPLYNSGRTDAQNNGLTHDNKASNPKKNYKQGLNTFNLSHRFATTERFGHISPFLSLDCVPRDVIPFRSGHNLHSYTMQSPIIDKSEIYKHKFYSLVPYKAILPNTWEIFYANPTQGSDVPEDSYCRFNLVSAFELFVSDAQTYLTTQLSSLSVSRANLIIGLLISSELVFSCGSLLSSLKCNLWPYFYKSKSRNIDVWYDEHFVDFACKNLYIQSNIIPGTTYNIYTEDYSGSTSIVGLKVSKHAFLDYLREGVGIIKFSTDPSNSTKPSADFITALTSVFESYKELYDEVAIDFGKTFPIDLSAPIAYQITCISQVTDPSIDYLYNASLFRNVLFRLPNLRTFNYNGSTYLYDVFSENYFKSHWFQTSNFLSTCQKLFSFKRSLKFGDYFTQMRPKPYAVGDLSVDSRTTVDVTEITRKIVYQRFLNWNNRVGPKYEDYIAELTGMNPLPDNTEPSLINHSKSIVGSYQVENTGDAQLIEQNSVTTLLRDNNSNFEFDIVVSEPSILLGLTSYDIPRLYTRTVDRSFFKDNRFDFFNPMLQYTGDQDIKGAELDVRRGDVPIGYNTKDIHYKMQVNRANGGFIFSLPSWAFTTEETDGDLSLFYGIGINPEFIRNTNSDFDRFYKSTTGYSLGTYFHFILFYDNDLSRMQRAMDVAPDIL